MLAGVLRKTEFLIVAVYRFAEKVNNFAANTEDPEPDSVGRIAKTRI
jgi:hypothetical protein